MKRIGIITSGGDAPGMNAVIHGVVETATELGVEVLAYRDGYIGLMANDSFKVSEVDSRPHIGLGGTWIGTGRTEEFHKPEVQAEVARRLAEEDGIDSLVVIGGDGSYKGALALSRLGLSVVAIPATIDNDIPATDQTLGFKTAIESVIKAVDILKDTATSHRHLYAVEAMGRRASDLAIWAGLALNADGIIIEESDIDLDQIVAQIDKSLAKGYRSPLFILAEGVLSCQEFKDLVEGGSDYSIHPFMLGHLQRGGSPVAEDRILGQLFGRFAVEYLADHSQGAVNLAVNKQTIVAQDIEETLVQSKETIYPFGYKLGR